MRHADLRSAVDHCLRQHCAELSGPLLEVCRYALKGGRRTRATLLLQAAERSDARAINAACAVEMLHAATLLQDDIFDCSESRRGRMATHIRFGKGAAILASDWLLIRSLELAGEAHPALFKQMARAARCMAQTVAQELAPGVLRNVDEAEQHIRSTAQGKTAALFATTLYAAALLCGFPACDPSRWEKIGSDIGCAYQMVDDCMDAYATQQCAGKPVGGDLRQGRLTLPLLLAMEWLREDESPLCLDPLLKGKLTPDESGAILDALQQPMVRRAVQQRASVALQQLHDDAAGSGLPPEVLACCEAQMQASLALCFGTAPVLLPLEGFRFEAPVYAQA